jgi:hypothetical protein
VSRVELAGKVKTNESQIIRIEAGTIDTRSSLLFAIIDAVRGDPNHIRRLMNSKATTEDARQLAQAVLRGFQEGGALKHVKTSTEGDRCRQWPAHSRMGVAGHAHSSTGLLAKSIS